MSESAVVRHLVGAGANVLNVDALTYVGNLKSLTAIDRAPNYRFAKIDVCDRRALADAFAAFAPDHVIHLAAESHVDRSITAGEAFNKTNIVVAFSMLEAEGGRDTENLRALQAALVEGEKSGQPSPFDFDAFLEDKRASARRAP